MTKTELEKEVERLEKKVRELFLEKTLAKIDIEYVEDNAFDVAVAQQIWFGDETGSMLKRFLEDYYGLMPRDRG